MRKKTFTMALLLLLLLTVDGIVAAPPYWISPEDDHESESLLLGALARKSLSDGDASIVDPESCEVALREALVKVCQLRDELDQRLPEQRRMPEVASRREKRDTSSLLPDDAVSYQYLAHDEEGRLRRYSTVMGKGNLNTMLLIGAVWRLHERPHLQELLEERSDRARWELNRCKETLADARKETSHLDDMMTRLNDFRDKVEMDSRRAGYGDLVSTVIIAEAESPVGDIGPVKKGPRRQVVEGPFLLYDG